MENYSHQSYPDSGDSSPLSREIDSENPASWDEPPAAAANYKVKFMCSYGGKIQPRSHDNQLSYVGGDTKILSIERNAPFSAFFAKLSSMCDAAPASEICFKYQLPDEDLDALISVTNDEDLEHMMLEYDRLNRSSPKPARLRIFLFAVNSKPNSEEYQFKEAKPEGSWFVDALNSVQYRSSENSSPPPPTPTPNPEPSAPDFLFGFDKAMPVNYKVGDPNPNSANDVSRIHDQVAVGEPANFIQNQMERFRIGESEMQKSYEEVNPNVNSSTMYQSEYYNVQEKVSLPPPQAVPVPMSAGYWPERQVVAGNFQVASGIPTDQQPVYVIQTPTGAVYHQNPSVRPIAGAPPGSGQAYYSVPHAMPETYREQPAYNAVPPQPSSLIQQHKVGMQEGIGMVRQPPLPPAPAMATEQGYTQVSYVDSSGRPIYYTIAGGGLAPPPQYQMMTTAAATVVDGRAVGGVGMGLDGKVVSGKPSQTSSV